MLSTYLSDLYVFSSVSIMSNNTNKVEEATTGEAASSSSASLEEYCPLCFKELSPTTRYRLGKKAINTVINASKRRKDN